MEWMVDEKSLLKTFKFSRYATEVTFKKLYRPSGSQQEGTKYFSGK